MKCALCQHENRPGAKFCEECATPQARACTNCGAQLSPTAKFCSECAHPARQGVATAPRFGAPEAYTPKHLAEKILTSKSALEGERKQVTVLFADLKGSMELLADRDPEEARRLLDPVLEHMMEAVHRYEGTVNQVMGDGIMALFGAPVAHEDHAVRACYAALRMQEGVRRYAESVRRQEGITVRIRVGINSGEVVVRAIGSDLHMDYTAVGLTTHQAARMEQLAEPGTALLTPATLALAEDFIQVRPLGPTPVKGLPEPVEIYEITGTTPVRSRFQAHAARGLTAFVGRTIEMTQLAEALGLAKSSRGQAVAVVGEPGVGKSRLFWEFGHSHRTEGCLVLESASVSYAKATTYLPVIELLRAYFQIEPRDDLRRIRERVTGRLLSLDRALEVAVAPLSALLDLPVEDPEWARLDPAQRRQRTLDALKRLLLRESQVQPLVVVFEDLHWIDGETQAVLDGLVESLPTVRVLLLVSYRPEYRHAWGSKTYYRQLRIDALPAASAEDLLRALLGHDPSLAPLERLLIERAEGNPLFLEESVRTLAETRILAGTRGAYRLARAPQNLDIPPTAQAIIAARVDRLEPEDKRLLQAAAVVGKDVPFPLLAAIADLPEDELRQRLGRLQAAEFLYEARLFPEVEYTFKHALTHEVTYGMILGSQRSAFHLRLVQALEDLAAGRLDEYVDRLAHHAIRAEAWDKAVEFLRRAGLKAVSRSANREARGHFDNALTCLAHMPDTPEQTAQAFDLHLDIVASAIPLLDFDTAAEHRRTAESLAVSLDDPRRIGRVASSRAMYSWLTGRLDDAVGAAQVAIGIGSSLADIALLARGQDSLGRALYSQGHYRDAKDVLQRNVSMLAGDLARERFGQQGFTSVFSRHFLARCCAAIGSFEEGHACAEHALVFAGDHPHSVLSASSAVAVVARDRGEFKVAASTLERAISLCENLEIKVWASILASDLGYAYVFLRRIPEGLPLLERAVVGAGSDASARLARLGVGYLLAGRAGDALAAAQRALVVATEAGERGSEAEALRILGDVVSHGDQLDTALATSHYGQALALAEPRGMRPLVAHCHLGLGKLYLRTGRHDQAREHLTIAKTMYREMDMRFWHEQSEAEIRTLCEVRGDEGA